MTTYVCLALSQPDETTQFQTCTSWSPIDQTMPDFDYNAAMGFWFLSFSTIITLFLVSHIAGQILGFIKRG